MNRPNSVNSLNIKPLPSIDSMNIESSILDPQTITQRRCIFQLDRKGILDANSMIQLGITVNSQAALITERCFLPLGTGIYSAIKSARLYCGTNVIATSEDVGYYHYIKELYKSSEERYLKSSTTKGTNNVYQPSLKDNSGRVGLKDTMNVGSSTNPISFKENNCPTRLRPTNDDSTTPLFYIKISDLFPMMTSLQLPLAFIDEPISIHLEFNTQTNPRLSNGYAEYGNLVLFNAATIVGENENPDTYDFGAKISLSNVKFIADYLTFDDNTMSQLASKIMSQEGILVPYEDLILTIRSEPKPAEDGIHDMTSLIAVAGRTVRSILVHCHQEYDRKRGNWDLNAPVSSNNLVNMNVAINPLLGNYSSDAPPTPLEYNVRVNDNNIYNRDINLPCQTYHEAYKVTGVDLNVNQGTYSWDAIIDSNPMNTPQNTLLVEDDTTSLLKPSNMGGFSQATCLQGTNYVLGLDLRKSQSNEIGTGTYIEKAIEWRMRINQTNQVKNSQENIDRRSGQPNADYVDHRLKRTFRFFTSVERKMLIKNGTITLTD